MSWLKAIASALGLLEWWTQWRERQDAEETGATAERLRQHEEALDARDRMDAAPSRPAADRLRDGSF